MRPHTDAEKTEQANNTATATTIYIWGKHCVRGYAIGSRLASLLVFG